MKYLFALLVIITVATVTGCDSSTQKESQTKEVPDAFLPALTPAGMIIHSGRLTPDGQSYYYTLSDSAYVRFNVWFTQKADGQWEAPTLANFSSEYSEHGTSFSPDGNTVFFSSTRPIDRDSAGRWQLFMAEMTDYGWGAPLHVEIPNMAGKSMSHPSISASGLLYFHASNPDYSEMTLYVSQMDDGNFGEAEKVSVTKDQSACTPYISPDGKTLIYAAIGEQLDLMISRKTNEGHWGIPKALPKEINTNGQGNPSLSPNGKYLFFTTGSGKPGTAPDWQVNRIAFSAEDY